MLILLFDFAGIKMNQIRLGLNSFFVSSHIPVWFPATAGFPEQSAAKVEP